MRKQTFIQLADSASYVQCTWVVIDINNQSTSITKKKTSCTRLSKLLSIISTQNMIYSHDKQPQHSQWCVNSFCADGTHRQPSLCPYHRKSLLVRQGSVTPKDIIVKAVRCFIVRYQSTWLHYCTGDACWWVFIYQRNLIEIFYLSSLTGDSWTKAERRDFVLSDD